MEKRIKMTNKEIEETLTLLNIMIQQLNKGEIIVDDPKFPYVIGRNLRILRSENIEYVDAKNRAVREFGEFFQEGEGNDEGGYRINMKDKEQYSAFEARVREIASIEHEFTIFAVPSSLIMSWNLPFSHRSSLWFLMEDGESMFE